MTPVYQLTDFVRSLFSLWALTICLCSLFGLVRSIGQKRYRFTVLSLLPFLCGYFLWQVLFDVHVTGGVEGCSASTKVLCKIPYIYWILILVAVTSAACVIYAMVRRYGMSTITPDAVKQCLDRIPCGVCCYGDDGRVLFSNVCMNRLYISITGERLSDGRKLNEIAGGKVLTAEERKWRFTERDLTVDGEDLHELIASDVTAEYAKTEALRRDKEELSLLNDKLKEYTAEIDDTVRRREILQAKINIHDAMNRLMLSTVAVEKGDTAAEDKIFSLWEQNALLLCMEADRNKDTEETEGIGKLADALRIRIVWENDLPGSMTLKQRELFFLAAKEALTNAAKHAGARTLTISFEETEDLINCIFANDGRLPEGDVRFAGGLYNLSLLAGKQGALIRTEIADNFKLILAFTKFA